MLYWNTVSDLLRKNLLILMQANELSDFRLVGGTMLSLRLGHRMSVDIDLFTDATYGSVNFDIIEEFLRKSFNYVAGDFGGNPGLGKSYMIGNNQNEVIKLDMYYSMDPFFQQLIIEDTVRMATIEEVIAMKVDVIQRGGRKKDFWDLHELLINHNINDMLALHQQRFEWTHDEALILQNFTNFNMADSDFDPICLRNKYWEFIKEDIEEAIASR